MRRSLVTRLGVLDDEEHREGKRGHQVWKMVSHRAGKPAAMLAAIHTPAAPTASTAASGREACRSTRDSHRLTAGARWTYLTPARNPRADRSARSFCLHSRNGTAARTVASGSLAY